MPTTRRISRGHTHLADLHGARGEHDAAFAVLTDAVAQAPRPAVATHVMRRLSRMAQTQGAHADALAWAERAVAADPFDAENHANLAGLYVTQDKLAEARQAAERAVELAPGHAAHLRRLSDIAWRASESDSAIDWPPGPSPAHPTDAQGHSHYATILIRRGENEAAEAPLSHAVELAPLDAGLLRRLSDLKMRLGKPDEALSLAERAIVVSPQDLAGYNHLATLLLQRSDVAGANAILNRALEVEPTNVPLLRRLAEVALRRSESAEAVAWLQLAIETDQKDPRSYDQLASLELALGNNPAAEEALTRAAALAGGNTAFHRRLSDLLHRRGDEQGALYWAERMVQDFPADPAGFLQLGGLHISAKRLDEAEAAFLQAHARAETPVQAIGPLHCLSDVATRPE